ncbi:NUDIX domain-containing protein [Halorubrum sp. N11]|uniref:NUDIX domain-containing protein n=1 Tax=Halorubrum sp. N11 TaxID=3402276 RepID=UPI003EBA44BE
MTSFPDYCGECGSELESKHIEGRERAYCSQCSKPVYRNAKPCGGVLVVDDEQVLLVKRTNPPAVGSWSLPAGFLEVDEPPEFAAARELQEETGISVSPDDLELFETNLIDHGDGTHVLVIIYRTTWSAVSGDVQAGSDAGDAQFWHIEELLEAGESIELGHESIMRRSIAET